MSCYNLLKTFRSGNAVAEVWDHEGSYDVFLYPKRGFPVPEHGLTSEGLMFTSCHQDGEFHDDLDRICLVAKKAKKWIKERVRRENVSMYKWTIKNDEDPETTSWARRKLASLNRKSA